MKVYRLIDKNDKVLFQGSLEDCAKKAKTRIEYVGVSSPVFKVVNNDGVLAEGTMKEISQKTGMPILTLYNYTRYKRKADGLYVEKTGEIIRKYSKDEDEA